MRLSLIAVLFITLATVSHGASAQSDPTGAAAQLMQRLEQGPKGTLTIRGVQSSKGGASLAGDEVEITLLHRDVSVKQFRGALNEQGVLVVDDVPIGIAVNPIVRIRHGGVQYQDEAKEMSAQATSAELEVKVYEVTDDAPAWTTTVRSLIAEKHPGFFAVSEMVVVENPGDRTWLGAPPDEQKRRATVSFVLPEGASDVSLVQGFHGWCCSALKGRTLSVQMPLMPGQMTYKFVYRVPMRSEGTPIEVAMPVPAGRIAVLLPDDGTRAESTTLIEGPASGVGAARLRMYEAKHVDAGREVGVRLLPPAREASVDTNARAGASTPSTMSIAIGAGVLGVVVVGAWRVMRGRGA